MATTREGRRISFGVSVGEETNRKLLAYGRKFRLSRSSTIDLIVQAVSPEVLAKAMGQLLVEN